MKKIISNPRTLELSEKEFYTIRSHSLNLWFCIKNVPTFCLANTTTANPLTEELKIWLIRTSHLDYSFGYFQ